MPTTHPALYVMMIAVAAALFSRIPARFRLPSAVLEMALGSVIGTHGFGILNEDVLLTWLGNAGLAALFFMSGLELDLGRIRGRPLLLALRGWLVSLVLGISAGLILYRLSLVGAPLLTGLALTTTTLGAVLAVLRDTDQLQTRFGLLVSAAGAAGEFGPVMVLSLLFTHGAGEWRQIWLMLTFISIAAISARIALRIRPPRLLEWLRTTMHSSTQLPVRLSLFLVILFLVLVDKFGFEIVLGAFAAGMVVGLASRGEQAQPLHEKMDGISYGFLVPFFFVMSGMRLDFPALLGKDHAIGLVPVFLVLFVIVRGVPVFLYRNEIGKRDLFPFALCSATALSMVIAVTQIAVETGRMPPYQGAAMALAAMISALLFPGLAWVLRSDSEAAERAA